MIAALLVLAALPFAPGATFSSAYQLAQPIEPLCNLRRAPRAAVRVDVPPAMQVAETQALETCDCDLITDCRGHCPIPAAGDVTDWESIYTVRVGFHLGAMHTYSWGPGVDPHEAALVFLKAAMQTINAAFVRDFGLQIEIAHVHFEGLEGGYAPTPAYLNNTERVAAVWASLLPQIAPLDGIMWLRPYPGGGAGGSTCGGAPGIGRAALRFDRVPGSTSTAPSRVDWGHTLRTLAHELGHQLAYNEHTQCYDPPIERCASGPPCYEGPLEYMPASEESFQGYCKHYTPHPPLRIGPRFGAMARVSRMNVLALAADCLGPPTAYADLTATADADADELPDPLDNCPAAQNWAQLDADDDGVGDACDGCQVGPPGGGSAWFLLLALVISRAARPRSRR